MREGHRQSDEHWNRLKGNVGETSERRGGAHMGFSERIYAILKWTELEFLVVRTEDSNAYNCTRGLSEHRERVCTETDWTLGEQIPCCLGESNLRQCCNVV